MVRQHGRISIAVHAAKNTVLNRVRECHEVSGNYRPLVRDCHQQLSVLGVGPRVGTHMETLATELQWLRANLLLYALAMPRAEDRAGALMELIQISDLRRAADARAAHATHMSPPAPPGLRCPVCKGITFVCHGHGGIQCNSCGRAQAAHWEPNPGSGA